MENNRFNVVVVFFPVEAPETHLDAHGRDWYVPEVGWGLVCVIVFWSFIFHTDVACSCFAFILIFPALLRERSSNDNYHRRRWFEFQTHSVRGCFPLAGGFLIAISQLIKSFLIISDERRIRTAKPGTPQTVRRNLAHFEATTKPQKKSDSRC